MTIEEAKTNVNKIIINSLNIMTDALEKAEKYKWHNLSENPNDLPKEKERIIFVVPNDQPYRYIDKTIFYSGELVWNEFCNDDYEGYVTQNSYKIEDVIKWKYIDIEEDNNEQ